MPKSHVIPSLLCGIAFLSPRAAFAESTLLSNRDVAGISLGMTAAVAKKTILDNNPGAVVSDVNVSFGTPQLSRRFVAGFAVDITSQADVASNKETSERFAASSHSTAAVDRRVAQDGDFGKDVMRLSFDVNDGEHKVFAVSRYIEYPKNNRPVMDTAVNSFIEKYGTPSFREKAFSGAVHLYWGMSGKSNALIQNCPQNAVHYNYPVDGGSNFRRYDPSRDVTGTSFNYLVNYINTNMYFKDWSACGVFLDVWIAPPSVVGQESSVSSIKEFFMDFPAAYNASKRYITDFWADANAAKQQDIGARAGNRPKL